MTSKHHATKQFAIRPAFQRSLTTALLCGVMLTSLSGCVEMVIGGAVVGALAVSDRRTIGAQTEDKTIVFKAEKRVATLVGETGHVNVNSFNRKVLLTGEVRDEQMKAAVERDVATVEGVQSIVNELDIAGTSNFGARSNDVLITGKVKASIVDTKELSVNSIKVVTERGIVYLMGRVTESEGKRAGIVASGVSGVRKVVKVFEYITEEELKKLVALQESQNMKYASK